MDKYKSGAAALLALILASSLPALAEPKFSFAATPGEDILNFVYFCKSCHFDAASLILPLPALARDPNPADRAFIAANIYHTVKRYFAHWQGLPAGYDFDAHFRAYLGEAIGAPDRRTFSLATMRLFASLQNGHTGFYDEEFFKDRPPPAFYAEPLDGRWTVKVSRVVGLDPGEVIVAIDGKPIEDWVEPTRAIIGQSNARARDSLVFVRPFLFPECFTLTLADGRHVMIDRTAPQAPRKGRSFADVTTTVVRPDGVVVITIPSFDDPKFEAAAVAAVKANPTPRLILFDLRGNGGGDTPEALLKAIMNVPYSETIVMTPLTIAEFDAHGAYDPATNPLPAPMVRYGPNKVQPSPDAFTGQIAVLVDRHCASACEDFVIRFKSARRGSIIGEPTWGSTGIPYTVNFSEFGMSFRVSTKREFFPDGSPFEGVGVAPDVALPPTPADFRALGDPQLERAVAAALAIAKVPR